MPTLDRPIGPLPLTTRTLHARDRRKRAQNFKKFPSSPFDLGSAAAGADLPNPFAMPAQGRLGVSVDAVTTVGQITATNGAGRAVSIAGGPAGTIFRLDHFERGQEVTVSSAVAGTVSLYVFDEWSRPKVIATGTAT